MLNSIMHSSHLLMTEGMKEGRKEARTEESRAAASIPSGFMRPLLVLLLLLHDPPRVMIPNFRSLPLSLPPFLPPAHSPLSLEGTARCHRRRCLRPHPHFCRRRPRLCQRGRKGPAEPALCQNTGTFFYGTRPTHRSSLLTPKRTWH